MIPKYKPLTAAMALILGGALSLTTSALLADDDGKELTIIHIGDIHGHTVPRPNLRSDGDGRMEGGLARMYTKVKQIRGDDADETLLINTGDTLQGSGEAVYSKGQALVDVLDMFKIDAYTPGNWDFVYGPARFKELFSTVDAYGNPKSKRWGGLVANVYETSTDAAAPKRPSSIGSEQDANISAAEEETYSAWYRDNGKRILPPYAVKYVNGIKVGIIGCTTSRGPQVVGSWVTDGLEFTDCSREARKFAEELRTVKKVDMVVLISEIEIGRNIQLMKSLTEAQHIDLVLNSDMHEETIEPIKVTNPSTGKETLIIEEGQDGTQIGELKVKLAYGKLSFDFTPHRIHDGITPNYYVAQKVAAVRAPYTTKFNEYKSDSYKRNKYHVNPFSGTYLNGSLDDVVGHTDVGLHRSNYSNENMPATIEGSSHDFIADAIRWWAQSDLATVRGFRYGTHVKPGPITRNDIFHFIPIGPRVAKVSRISANQLRNQIDNSSKAVLSSDPSSPVTPLPRYNNLAYTYGGALAGTSPGAGLPAYGLAGSPEGWGGGWMFAYSGKGGISFNFAPYYNTNVVYNADNTITAAPPTNTSRARSLTVKMLCKDLPPAEIAAKACDVADLTTRHATVITTAADGVYTGSWKASYTNGQVKNLYPTSAGYTNNARSDADATDATTACNLVNGVYANNTCGYTPWLLNPDGWQYLNGTPNQPNTKFTVNQHFKAGLFTVAGYFYAQSPNTINNCNNCYPTGRSTVVGDPNAAYLLPVNVKADGTAALDANGNPLYVRDATTNAVIMENGKPKIEGEPIDLTVIVEKYLASFANKTLTEADLPLNRIGLVSNDGLSPITLPDYSTTSLGIKVMQPLCGTIGQDPMNPTVCP